MGEALKGIDEVERSRDVGDQGMIGNASAAGGETRSELDSVCTENLRLTRVYELLSLSSDLERSLRLLYRCQRR